VGLHDAALGLADEVLMGDAALVRVEGATLAQCDGVHPALRVGQLHGVAVGEGAAAAMDTGQRRSRLPASGVVKGNRPEYRHVDTAPTVPSAPTAPVTVACGRYPPGVRRGSTRGRIGPSGQRAPHSTRGPRET